MQRETPSKTKVDERANVHRPDESATRKDDDSTENMAQRGESVKPVESPLRVAVRELIAEELNAALLKEPWLTLGLVKDNLREIVAWIDRDDPQAARSLAKHALVRLGEAPSPAEVRS